MKRRFWEPEHKKPSHKQPLDPNGQPIVRALNAARISDRAVDELIGLCRGVLADGEVVKGEANFLLEWLNRNRDAATKWPGNILTILIFAFCTVGCAMPKGGKWCHDYRGATTFEKDKYECSKEADMRRSGDYDLLSWPGYFNECMRHRGWYGCGEKR